MQWMRIAAFVAKHHRITLSLLDDEGIGIGKRFPVNRPGLNLTRSPGTFLKTRSNLPSRSGGI
jgi:hypothetical protein